MIWITGSKGLLGQELTRTLVHEGLPFIASGSEVDICDLGALNQFLAQQTFPFSRLRWIVNCAAYTAVDKAEDEPERCNKINVTGPANLAAIARQTGARLLHFSTDYVFDGTGWIDPQGQRRAYREDDPVTPLGAYGQSKAQGEQEALKLADACIVRTAWLFGQHGKNFVTTMLRLMKAKPSVAVVADQWGSPTSAHDLSQIIIKILTAEKPITGIWNFSNQGVCSWHEFALEIYRLGRELGLIDHEVEVRALKTSEYPTKAKRPAWSVLSKQKIEHHFGITIRDWKASLNEFMQEMQEDKSSRHIK